MVRQFAMAIFGWMEVIGERLERQSRVVVWSGVGGSMSVYAGLMGFFQGCGRNVLRGVVAAKWPTRDARNLKNLFSLVKHE